MTNRLAMDGIGGRVPGLELTTKISIHNRDNNKNGGGMQRPGIRSGCGGSHGAGGLICVVLVEFP